MVQNNDVEPPAPLIRVVRAGEGPRLQSDHADLFATLPFS